MSRLKSFKFRFPVLVPALIILTATGCVKSKDCQTDEQSQIKTYLQTNGISENTKTAGGIYFIESDTGIGKTPETGNFVYINYTGRTLDGAIHETSDITLKNDWPYAQYYILWVYGPLKFQYGNSIAGINEGLSLMREGAVAKLIIPSNKAFYDCNTYVYDIQLLKVIRDPVAYEDSILSVYRTENNFDTTTYYKGIYIKKTHLGNNTRIQSGYTITFTMVGHFVECYDSTIKDTRQFDSTEVVIDYGTTNTLQSTLRLPIPTGVTTALDSLDNGSTAKVLIPYDKGFGKDGYKSPTYGYIIVPSYQTVIYTIKVTDISLTATK